MKITILTNVLLAALLSMIAGTTNAYSEDICNISHQSRDLITVENCWDLQCQDDNASGPCAVKGVLKYLQATALANEETPPAHSILHFDLVWMMARLAGFSSDDATVVAAHSQAADLVQYTHRHVDSGRDYVSLALPGLDRWNLRDGFWVHFPPRSGSAAWAPYTDSGTLTDYDPHSSGTFGRSEVALNHVRQWAFGQRHDLCKFGLVGDDGHCVDSTRIWVSMPAIAGLNFPLPSMLGPQPVDPERPGLTLQLNGTSVALGIYLHVLGDRLSHFYCTQYAFSREVRGVFSTYYKLDYPGDRCGQLRHAAMHYHETGHGEVPPRTENVIDLYFAEMQAWLDAHPRHRAHTAGVMPDTGAVDKHALKTDILAALAEGGAAQRMSALCLASMNHGLGWHDGNYSCQYRAPD